MLRGKSNFLTLAALVVAITIQLSSMQASAVDESIEVVLPPLPSVAAPPMPAMPACLDKPMKCVNDYLKDVFSNVADISPEPKPICCPEWKTLIENDPKCYCDSLGSAATTNATQLDASLKLCNIDATAKTLCNDVIGKSTNGAPGGTKWYGILSTALMLLSTGLFLY